jgi:hypothetical protein
VPGRDLVIGGTADIILYRVPGNRVTMKTIWHGAKRRQHRGYCEAVLMSQLIAKTLV